MRPEDLHSYQIEAYQHILKHPSSMLWLSMGLGKTISTLSALQALKELQQTNGTLVVAPLRVCRTVWGQEAKKWDHTRGLTFSYIVGTARQRLQGMLARRDVYLINYENLPWLTAQLEHYYVSRGRPMPFDTIVFDEISKMKNSQSKRAKAFRRVLPLFHRRIGLTGTPASNGLLDLHGQFLSLDDGARLGSGVTKFKERFFFSKGPYELAAFPDSLDRIKRLVSDITLHMDASMIKLPPFNINDIVVQLTPKHQAAYDKLETEMFLELDSGEEVEVFNAAAKTNKCLQYANGNVYTEPPLYESVHEEKMDALREIMEETGDDPLLLAYAFRSDAAQIIKAYPDAINLTDVKPGKLNDVMASWNRGEIKLMLGHPASMGHGLNLQAGGRTLIWFGLNWSLDLYEQFNARIARQGQKLPVLCHRILTDSTLDLAVKDALAEKATTQESLKAAVDSYRKSKGL